MLNLLKALVLGVIEGITEWLPISSTGHLILADEFIRLDMSDAFVEMFNVVVQLGAILAVVVLFWGKLWPFGNDRTAVRRKGEGAAAYFVRRWCVADTWIMWFKVLVAILPAMVVGLPLDDWMTEHLHTPVVVAAMLILYGILFIWMENRHKTPRIESIEGLSWAVAFGVGMFQVLSLVPGTSRSGATILGAMLLGCTRTVAAEFTFFLAIPVMFGASLIKVLKFGLDFTGAEVIVLLVGMLSAFIVSMLCIQFLMNYVKRHDFKVFGWYRIALGALVLLYFLALKPLLG
ncbi:MAG TPA: undecaprenyl-diphosphate phosphatase [Candidatus Ruthenibacterium merdigallinarum]|nr:undecaprenyl-diphosphate phosphatase [Candidatus Ruthenibacterium merdigallinarum]